MKTIHLLIPLSIAGLVIGCASLPPKELVNARSSYRYAAAGPAAQLAPAELHVANQALEKAEKSFQDEPNSYQTRDLAYVAQRKAQLAGAIGVMAADKANKETANADFQKQQTNLLKQGKQDLSNSEKRTTEALATVAAGQARQDLSDSEKRAADALIIVTAEKASADLLASEKRTAAALAKLAAVKEEERGMVITLSGSVLFVSNKDALIPSARTKLNQVAQALLTVKQPRHLIIEGYTDSQGADDYNLDLSQRRADAVRAHLVSRGYPADKIEAIGIGEGRPIASNDNAEGRANNRRVEIVAQRPTLTSNQ